MINENILILIDMTILNNYESFFFFLYLRQTSPVKSGPTQTLPPAVETPSNCEVQIPLEGMGEQTNMLVLLPNGERKFVRFSASTFTVNQLLQQVGYKTMLEFC